MRLMQPSRKLKVNKKRLSRYLKEMPARGEVSQMAIAYSRAVTYCQQNGIKVPLDLAIALKRFEAYLGYRVKA